MAIEAGRVLSQRYRLIRPVGQGSQASVWVAEHLALQTHVAVKLIDPELAKKETARERFRREATAAAQLRSAHVVQILDHGIDGDQPFIVMELLDGEDLFERLSHRGRLSLRETSKIVTQVARAVSRAHAAGIVHRDLKPENVFLVPNEDDEVVKVLDFGVAKVKDAARVTMQKTNVGTLIGTPHYMSPEQVKGIGEVDFRTDLWAIGVIAFQCITGEMPFDSEGVGDLLIKISMGEIPVPSKTFPGSPVQFDPWFAKACERDPAKRFQSAREVALSLAAVVTQIDGTVPRAPTVRPPAAALPALTRAFPAPPRVPGITAPVPEPEEHFEEADPFDEDEDDRPTRMREAPEPTSKAPEPRTPPPRPQTSIGLAPPPRPTSPSVPRMAAVTGGSVAPRPATAPRTPVPALTPAPTPPPPPPVEEPAALDAAPGGSEGHEIVDFDETIPATAEHRLADLGLPPVVRSNAQAELAWPEQPRTPSPRPPPPAAAPLPQVVIAPVMLAPPVALTPPRPPQPEAAPVFAPRPPPAQNYAPPSTPMVRPVEFNASDASIEAPPGMDGASNRRRMVRVMVAGLLIVASVITWTVVRSQLGDGSTVSGTPSATSATSAPPPPPPPPSTTATTTATAVDPGKVTRPTKPPPTVKGPLKRPQKKAQQPNDGTIVVPDPPDEDSVPAAP